MYSSLSLSLSLSLSVMEVFFLDKLSKSNKLYKKKLIHDNQFTKIKK